MKKLFYSGIAFLGLAFWPGTLVNAQSGGVAVNAAGTPPDSSALFDVSSNSKGELMPRMSTTQRNAIVNPAVGLTIFNTDCNVYNYNAGTTSAPNWATLSASNVLTAGLSISANSAGAVCAGSNVTFTATPYNGINAANYQWQVNGANVGSNSATYTSSGLNNGDMVTCILSTSQACVTGSPATSNVITMVVNTVPVITGTTPAGFCNGNSVTLQASTNLGTINWYADSTGGSSLLSGASLVRSGLNSTTTFYVDATANGCTTASRTPVTATYYPNIPGQPGTISGPLTVNKNDTATYSISALPNVLSYAWTVSSGTITSGQGTTSILVTWGNSSGIGTVSVDAGNPCGTSAAQTIGVNIEEQIFSYTGSMQSFTVPAAVTSVTIETLGAQGAWGSIAPSYPDSSQIGAGGLGGEALGTLNVTPGQILYIFTGGQNGYNGGGAGGPGLNESEIGPGGNGGGASDVRVGGTDLGSRVIIAGGGGGGGGQEGSGGNGEGGVAGGTGGGEPGGAGLNTNYIYGYATGGGGGTQSGGGAPGCYTGGGECGYQGSLGQGGNGTSGNGAEGGGGGGGYYGGGGGGSWGGGSGGGGGDGYLSGSISGGAMQSGVQSGNGQVIISW